MDWEFIKSEHQFLKRENDLLKKLKQKEEKLFTKVGGYKLFEYMRFREIDMASINEAGEAGWELCAIETIIGMPSYCVYYFKREILR